MARDRRGRLLHCALLRGTITALTVDGLVAGNRRGPVVEISARTLRETRRRPLGRWPDVTGNMGLREAPRDRRAYRLPSLRGTEAGNRLDLAPLAKARVDGARLRSHTLGRESRRLRALWNDATAKRVRTADRRPDAGDRRLHRITSRSRDRYRLGLNREPAGPQELPAHPIPNRMAQDRTVRGWQLTLIRDRLRDLTSDIAHKIQPLLAHLLELVDRDVDGHRIPARPEVRDTLLEIGGLGEPCAFGRQHRAGDVDNPVAELRVIRAQKSLVLKLPEWLKIGNRNRVGTRTHRKPVGIKQIHPIQGSQILMAFTPQIVRSSRKLLETTAGHVPSALGRLRLEVFLARRTEIVAARAGRGKALQTSSGLDP